MLSKHCLPTLPNLSEDFLRFSPSVVRIFHIYFDRFQTQEETVASLKAEFATLKGQIVQYKENTLKRDKVIQGLMTALKDKQVPLHHFKTEGIRKTSVPHNF